jgi:hypothetical protein
MPQQWLQKGDSWVSSKLCRAKQGKPKLDLAMRVLTPLVEENVSRT